MLINYSLNVKNAGFLAVLVYIITCFACTSKKGCTDPASVNYTADAKIDDGTCSYPEKSMDVIQVTEMEKFFKENSGIQYLNGQLWTFNDGGGENKIYKLNIFSGSRSGEIELKDVVNTDFEALASSGSHFFIGDIGNNQGERTDLSIYKFPVPSESLTYLEVSPERIRFTYPEQEEFNENPETNFDAEALLFHQEKLYLFTKNHGDRHTILYEIPSVAGEYDAVAQGRLNVEMLVTDAAISDQGDKVVLVGHDYSQVYLWLFQDFEGAKFFTGKKTRVVLGPMSSIGQVEGVAFYDSKSVLISNEQHDGIDPKLYYLDLSGIE